MPQVFRWRRGLRNEPAGRTGAARGGQPSAAEAQRAASSEPEEIDTEAKILTVLGLAKKSSVKDPGPQTGSTVSPILWQAAHDTLDFVKYASEDPLTGSIVTDWYSPPGKPNERYRVNVFILSRALHSDSLAVTVDRQQRRRTGNGPRPRSRDRSRPISKTRSSAGRAN